MLGMDPRSPPGVSCPAAAGIAPAACASAAETSSEVMCTCAGEGDGEPCATRAGDDKSCGEEVAVCACGATKSCEPLSPGAGEGWSSCAIFSWNDCAFAAACAGVCGVATGAGRFNTRISATADITSVATLIMRSSFHFFMATSAPLEILPAIRRQPVVTKVIEE